MSCNFRIGQGYDVHRLVTDRELHLCGVHIPHTHGLLGHSDADVAIHALCDALLGAAALRDIGYHFPDSDPKYKGIDSRSLLAEVTDLLHQHNYAISNVDVTIIAQAPKLASYIEDMRSSLAAVMKVAADCVSVKATTTEGLGFEGEKQGIAAQAVTLIYSKL